MAKVEKVFCDNCGTEVSNGQDGNKPHLVRFGRTRQEEWCSSCLSGHPPVDVEAGVATWPRLVHGSDLRQAITLRENRLGEARSLAHDLEDELTKTKAKLELAAQELAEFRKREGFGRLDQDLLHAAAERGRDLHSVRSDLRETHDQRRDG